MKTPTELPLKSLEDDLQGVLRAKLCTQLFQVRCRFRAKTLQVFIQHPTQHETSKKFHHYQIYSLIGQFLVKANSLKGLSCELSSVQQIQIFLYHTGARQPYAKRAMTLSRKMNVVTSAAPESSAIKLSECSSQIEGKNLVADIDLTIGNSSDSSPTQNPLTLEERASDLSVTKEATTTPPKPALAIVHTPATEQPTVQEEELAEKPPSEKSLRKSALAILQSRWLLGGKRWRTTKAIAAGLVLALTSMGIYAVTRPCVIGKCTILDSAQDLTYESEQLLSTVKTQEEVVEAYEKLIEANYQLARIPFWSAHYDEAQFLLTRYQAEADFISQIVLAQRQAQEATLSAQDAPHPLTVWEDIRGQWREAIAQLSEVPSDTRASDFAHTKLSEYRTYLSTVDQHILQEQDAQAKIAAAREAAQIAESRESDADSAESWQLVYVTWQVVMNRLADVSKDTMAYAEAQHLNAIYTARLETARNRHLQEQASHNAYSQAIALAEQAMQSEQDGQLTQAMVAWQNALAAIEQIPAGTSYHDQARPLVRSYGEELVRTEEMLAEFDALEQHRPTLNRVCTANSSSPVCSYRLGLNRIQVFVAEPYAGDLRQALRIGLSNTDTASVEQPSFARELPKITALLQTISTIGSDRRVAIELLTSDNQVIATYEPDLGGYVQAGLTIHETDQETNQSQN